MRTIGRKIRMMVLACLFVTSPLSAQTDLSVALIPDSLRLHAYSVVRFDTETFTLNSPTSGGIKKSYAITVLDEKGEDDALFRFNGDVFNVMKGFSARLYDAQGKQLKKFGQSDVMTSEYSSSLASDSKMYLFKCNAPSIPYTVKYEYEVVRNNGILTYGFFAPRAKYDQSVQNRHYQINLPSTILPRIKSINTTTEHEVSTSHGVTSYVWHAENLKAIEYEPLAPPFIAYVPYTVIVPTDFSYDGVEGSISSWSDLGKWSYNLTLGRDMVPEALKVKILERTKLAKTDREKVQLLYDYLGESTRYVSIQLGIGGYQPMTAAEVYRTGFGDCKALTNYLKAMLSVVGIHSEYTTIRLDKYEKRLLPDFPNFHELNHAVLKVPLPGDTLWLECTNPKVPFGFAHQGIAGHDALACRAEGSELVRVPDYADSLNLESHVVRVKLLDDGSADVNVHKQWNVKIYDQHFGFPLKKATDQSEFLRKEIHLPNVVFGTLNVSEIKSALPSLALDYSWSTSLYGSKTGNRLFLPVNVFRVGFDDLRKANRVRDVYINIGFRDADSLTIEIPSTFEIEALPPTVSEVGTSGRFTSSVTVSGNVIKIVQVFDGYTGTYKASQFPAFMAFLNKVTAAYRGKIILRRKSI